MLACFLSSVATLDYYQISTLPQSSKSAGGGWVGPGPEVRNFA
jgi:hypothetical protein